MHPDGGTGSDPLIDELTAKLDALNAQLVAVTAAHSELRASSEARVHKLEQQLATLRLRAARYDAIVGELRSGEAPRALRLVLPLARLLHPFLDSKESDSQTAAALATTAPAPAPSTPPPNGPKASFKTMLGGPVRRILRGLRRLVDPVLSRTRDYLNAPTYTELTRLREELQALHRQTEAIMTSIAITRNREDHE